MAHFETINEDQKMIGKASTQGTSCHIKRKQNLILLDLHLRKLESSKVRMLVDIIGQNALALIFGSPKEPSLF